MNCVSFDLSFIRNYQIALEYCEILLTPQETKIRVNKKSC